MKDYKVLGFCTLHYGLEYLRESLLSIRDHVDKMVISYTAKPSHGYRAVGVCPDSEAEMKAIAIEVLGDKLIWDYSSFFPRETDHRNVKYKYSKGYDLILTIDADEVFKESEINTALQYAYDNNERYYGIDGYVNFWRSFNWVCYDGFRPIRIENLNRENTLQNINCPLTIYHFSTCQSEAVMRYKYRIFGHASEIKKDYLDLIFYKWTPENNFSDLHPVSISLWNAVRFDKNTLPEYLKHHNNYSKELV